MASDRGGSGLAELQEAAMRLLARREHSYAELTGKLMRKGWPEQAVGQLVQALADAGLQSDERFAEVYLRSRAGKAYGPLRIRAELSERGIDRSLVERAMGQLQINWLERAAQWYDRRYRGVPAADLKEKSRRQQALARRGFDMTTIRDIMD